ncbi:nuclear movement domain-containing protein, putative [Eimeria tenella]|uniref:Nuclear movement domain-containing protein, putative n=1 Tax=Eimeria tenella TaxID=5802 RepID=U6L1H6_EIMTE|nr:nuclear movement domain-containing protein, putative [Eimeria tenella]CDJ41620.1 nuclear movement domain-containing protein, putative [Eimeria tenella]|eukprot:XP_013232370.1 nuclear movement domain-containing protein, putative [Eimeria tenella]
MVDYSKWDKLEVDSSDEETPGATCAPRKHALPGKSSSSSSSSSSRGIDYSKWDHIGDDEEEETPAPRVRRLTKDEAVTIGPEGLNIHPKNEEAAQQQQQLQQWMEEEQQQEMGEMGMSFEDAHEWPRCGPVQAAELPAAAAAAADAAAAAAGLPAVVSTGLGKSEMQKLVRNGGVSENKYFWRQTANEVVLSLALPLGVRGRDLRVHLTEHTLKICCASTPLLPPASSSSDASSSRSSSSSKEHVLLEGSFPHPVEPDEDSWLWEVTERRINWKHLKEIATQQQRSKESSSSSSNNNSSSSSSSNSESITELPQETLPPALFFVDLHLRKKKILPSADLWWSCILKGEVGIDVSQLADRRHSEKTQSFKEAWDAAHAAFKERIKQQGSNPVTLLTADGNAAAATAAAGHKDSNSTDVQTQK